MRPIFRAEKRYIPFWLHRKGSHHAETLIGPAAQRTASIAPAGKPSSRSTGPITTSARTAPEASRHEYDRLIGEWLARGRTPEVDDNDVTIVELLAAFRRYAIKHYRKDGKPTGEAAKHR